MKCSVILTLTMLLISNPVVSNQADLTLRQDAPQNFYATFVRDGRKTINPFLNPTLLEAKNKPTQQSPAQDRVHKKAFLLGYLSSFYLHPIFSGKKSGSETKKEESTTTAATTTTTASTTTTTPKPYKHKDTKYVHDYDEEDYDDDEYYHECYHEDHKYYRRYKK